MTQTEIQFRAKPQAKARKGWMLFVFAGLMVWAMLNGMQSGFDPALLVTVLALLVLFGTIFTVQHLSSPRDGEVVMAVTASEIEAERFATAKKSFLWTEILSARVYRYNGNQYLEFRVTAAPSRPNRFSLLKGVNPCAPVFPLDLLGLDDQQNLLALIREKTELHI